MLRNTFELSLLPYLIKDQFLNNFHRSEFIPAPELHNEILAVWRNPRHTARIS